MTNPEAHGEHTDPYSHSHDGCVLIKQFNHIKLVSQPHWIYMRVYCICVCVYIALVGIVSVSRSGKCTNLIVCQPSLPADQPGARHKVTRAVQCIVGGRRGEAMSGMSMWCAARVVDSTLYSNLLRDATTTTAATQSADNTCEKCARRKCGKTVDSWWQAIVVFVRGRREQRRGAIEMENWEGCSCEDSWATWLDANCECYARLSTCCPLRFSNGFPETRADCKRM